MIRSLIISLSSVCLAALAGPSIAWADNNQKPPHSTVISLKSNLTTTDHIVETGRGQRFTVTDINPIKYDARISDSTTTIATNATIPSIATAQPVGRFSIVICCESDISNLKGEYTTYPASFSKATAGLASDATKVLAYLAQASDYYDRAGSVDPNTLSCLQIIQKYALWLKTGRTSTIPSEIQKGCTEDISNAFSMIPDISAYQESRAELLKKRLTAEQRQIVTSLDLSAYLHPKQSLSPSELSLEPFSDMDASGIGVFFDVWCHPYSIDGVSHALTLTATNRFKPTDSTMNLSQGLGAVDCPGALSGSAGGGISKVPLVSYQLVPTLVDGKVTDNTIEFQQNARSQSAAAAFIHYYLLPLGGQAGLFLTGGVGTSSSSLTTFVGLSVGVGRRVYLNIAENTANVTELATGFTLHEMVQSPFTIPTMIRPTTRISFTISVGGQVSAGSNAASTPGGGSQKGHP